jgi:hypothetical protein
MVQREALASTKTALTDAQKSRIKGNRQRALDIRQAKCLNNSSNTPLLAPVSISVSTNSASSPEQDIRTDPSPTANASHVNNHELPPFIPLFKANFTWGTHDSATIKQAIETVYEEVIYWRRNLFPIPSGHAGTNFVQETARLFESYATSGPLEPIALKSVAIMSHLLLQKPFAKSKNRDHLQHLSRRMAMWEKGDIIELLSEARLLQSRHQSACESNRPEDTTRRFTQLMHQGKVNNALSLITEGKKGGVLPLTPAVLNALSAKHPPAEPLDTSAILPTSAPFW